MDYPFKSRTHPRLAGYDYRLSNAYFVTITTHGAAQLFGNIDAEGLHLSEGGAMVDRYIQALPEKFPCMALDEKIVMPDHIHLLLTLGSGETDATKSPTLSETIQWLKTMTTNAYIRGVKEFGWPPFERKIWHTSFHDRIVRNGDELEAIRRYIQRNPERRWDRMCAEAHSPQQ